MPSPPARPTPRAVLPVAVALLSPLLLAAAAAGPEVCVIAPQVEADGSGLAHATVPLSQPTIFVRDPLAAVRLRQGATVLWERRADASGAIEGPIAWPLAPLRPGESLLLELQPSGNASAGLAPIRLSAAPGPRLRRNDALVAGLGRDPRAWEAAVTRAMEQGDRALTTALLFAFEGPSSAQLDALRLAGFQRSCQEGPGR